jgi:hypothetical protein
MWLESHLDMEPTTVQNVFHDLPNEGASSVALPDEGDSPILQHGRQQGRLDGPFFRKFSESI